MSFRLGFMSVLWGACSIGTVLLAALLYLASVENRRSGNLLAEQLSVSQDLSNRLKLATAIDLVDFAPEVYWEQADKASSSQVFEEAILRDFERFDLVLTGYRGVADLSDLELTHTAMSLEFEGSLADSIVFIDDLGKRSPPVLISSFRLTRMSDFEQVQGQTRVRVSLIVWGLIMDKDSQS